MKFNTTTNTKKIMKLYANLNGNSDVVKYEISEESITIIFKHGEKIYTTSTIGKHHVNTMKFLAETGCGLSTYFNKSRALTSIKYK